MNLHQFRFVQEAVRRQLNLTETAKALHTSQPGISKAILELEEELGIDIFARYGKRLKRVTEPGEQVLKSVEIIMREVANLATKAGVEGDGFSVHTPLLHMSKADIAAEAARLGLDAGMSWSCYDPTPDSKACGRCDSCRLRAKGFADAGLTDPTVYA